MLPENDKIPAGQEKFGVSVACRVQQDFVLFAYWGHTHTAGRDMEAVHKSAKTGKVTRLWTTVSTNHSFVKCLNACFGISLVEHSSPSLSANGAQVTI